MNKNNFTRCVWWALIEGIASLAEAREKEMVCCIRGYHVYKGAAIGEVLVCSREPTNVGKFFFVRLYLCKIFYMFSVSENTFKMKKKSELR